MASVFYAGPNANTVIPVRSTPEIEQKYPMLPLPHQQQNGHTFFQPSSLRPQPYPLPTTPLQEHVTALHVPASAQGLIVHRGLARVAGQQKEDGVAWSWTWSGTVLSVLSMVFFVSFFGFLGLLFSIFAYVDHKSGDAARARRKHQWATSCAATGMVITVLGVIAVVLIFVVFYEELEDVLNDLGYYRD